MSLYGLEGEIRRAVRSAPIAAATASVTSTANRMRFSTDPPHSSVRRLVPGARNWWMRYPFAPCSSTPSKPASIALRAADTKSSMVARISCAVSSLGTTKSLGPSCV
jgi:hypothetical protein